MSFLVSIEPSSVRQVTTSELTHQLLQSDYFLDINPRILQRLINIIAMSGRLLRANQVLFSWKRLGCWSYLVEQWPYRMTYIIVYYEDHEQEYPEDTALKTLYDKYDGLARSRRTHGLLLGLSLSFPCRTSHCWSSIEVCGNSSCASNRANPS